LIKIPRHPACGQLFGKLINVRPSAMFIWHGAVLLYHFLECGSPNMMCFAVASNAFATSHHHDNQSLLF